MTLPLAGAAPLTPLDRLRAVTRFSYQLQNLNVSAAAAAPIDLLITDPMRNDGRLSPRQVRQLQTKPDGSKRLVLAYLSIGEAEDYRDYWQAAWAKKRPLWLGPENPDWPGNFKVRYWMPDWQRIILGNDKAPLDHILADGYDGVYLDIVDGYEYWQAKGVADAPQRMVTWVRRIAEYGRAKRPGFLVVPQNGEGLTGFAGYTDLVDGIGKEDVFFDGDDVQDADATASVLRKLKPFRTAHKPVFLIEYCTKTANKRTAIAAARGRGFVPLIAPRDLDKLTVSP